MNKNNILYGFLAAGVLVGGSVAPILPVTTTQGITEQVDAQGQPIASLLSSLELYWNTTTGDLSPGQYGFDETGNFYWAYFPATSTPAFYAKVPKNYDVSSLSPVQYMGERGVDFYTNPDGSFTEQIITQQQYQAEATQTMPKKIDTKQSILEALTPITEAATVTVIAGSDSGALTGASGTRTSDTFAVTVSSSGQNETYVAIGNPGSGAFSSATLGGQSMTLPAKQGTSATCQFDDMAYKQTPLTGSQSLVLNFPSQTGSDSYRGISLQDVNGFDADAIKGTASASTISQAITTTVNGDLVMAMLVVGTAVPANTWSATDIATSDSSGVGKMAWSYLTQNTAGSITASYNGFTTQCPQIYVFSFTYKAPTTAGSSKSFIQKGTAFLLNAKGHIR